MELGNAEDAEDIYRDLVKRNPENGSYYEGIEKCLAAKSPDGICESLYIKIFVNLVSMFLLWCRSSISMLSYFGS